MDAVERHIPIRTCIGCRRKFPAADLVRFSCTDESLLVLDEDRKGRGRGAWVCLRRRCLKAAIKRNAFPRSFRRRVAVPDTDCLWALIAGRLGQP